MFFLKKQDVMISINFILLPMKLKYWVTSGSLYFLIIHLKTRTEYKVFCFGAKNIHIE